MGHSSSFASPRWVALVGVWLAACSSALPRNATVEETTGQTTADARISTTSPLIVEWPAAERGRLEARMQRGAVAVRYEGATLELLPDCIPTGSYLFAPMVPKSEHLIFESALDLDASFPLGAARLGGRLHSGKQLELTTRLVGRWELSGRKKQEGERPEACAKATHLVSAATVGAFRLYSSTAASAGTDLHASPGGIRASGNEERTVLNSDGSPELCSENSAKGPPADCGALIRLELTSFERPRLDLLEDLGTLDFTPIEKRTYGAGLEARFEAIRFPEELCAAVAGSVYGEKRRVVSAHCDAASERADKPHAQFPSEDEHQALLDALTPAPGPLARLLAIDSIIRKDHKADPKVLAELQKLADEHEADSDVGFWGRYLLSGCGSAEVEERNLRDLIGHQRFSSESWPRMRLADRMLARDRAHAVAIAQSARSLASMCSDERLKILEWLASEGTGVLSSGELFDIQLDAVRTMSARGELPSTSSLGHRAIQSHDFQTWDASKKGLEKDQWALGALYWSEGAECLYRGNQKCAALEWRELLEKAPHSPYVVPAYHALLRVTGQADSARLAQLSALRPQLQLGSEQRKAIAKQPSCGALSDDALQKVLDEAQQLAVLHAHQLRDHQANWEVDSLSAIAPDLSTCAVEHPSNGKQRLLQVRISPEKKKRVRVVSADKSPESRNLAACVEQRTSGNASLFSTAFQVTIRVAPEPKISFDHSQGWARHVRERFACAAGDDSACIRLGQAWLQGGEIPREPGQALAIFTAKCAEGTPQACVEEALLRAHGKTRPKARALLASACDRGQGAACRHLARIEKLAKMKELRRYHQLLRKGCEATSPDPASCVELWYAHKEGLLPPLPIQASANLLDRACRILGDGTVDAPCGSPEDLMRAFPHRAGGALGKLTCERGIWQGCESAFLASDTSTRPLWAQAGCKSGSPDACDWLAREQPGLSKKQQVEYFERALDLCKSYEETGHESVCKEQDEVRSQLKVLRWRKPSPPAKKD